VVGVYIYFYSIYKAVKYPTPVTGQCVDAVVRQMNNVGEPGFDSQCHF